MTIYEVKDENHQVAGKYFSEKVAVKNAKSLPNSRVVMTEKSGTYKSTTCVWPEVGPTYSN